MYVSDIMVREAAHAAKQRMSSSQLYLPELRSVCVRRTWWPAAGAYAYYKYDERVILVPSISLARVAWFREPECLVDTLVHEYGHAVDDLLKLWERWYDIKHPFGAWDVSQRFSPAKHVSTYAATEGCEDFAECYRCLVEAKGRISRKLPQLIQKKLKFVRKVVRCHLRGKKFPSS